METVTAFLFFLFAALASANVSRLLGPKQRDNGVKGEPFETGQPLDAAQLESAMDIAAQTADDMELEISGDRDDL